jgi:CRP-like cAMP-binding protein
MNALVLIGGKALNLLDSSFYRSGQNTQVLQRIIQTMGRIGGQRAKDLLWNKIDYPDKVIVSQVLLSLGECGFKAGIAQMTRIKYAIESDIGDISWTLSALDEIGDDENTAEVRHALEREIQNDIAHIYMLLAMLYDTRSIQLVKESIESGTSEGTTYAVELLDVFLSEQLKQRVIPVLDDLSIGEKINRLEAFYPRVRLDEKLVLKFLINRDFAQTNRWTKACVLHQIGAQRIEDFTLDLIAQIFNPDRIVREVAAWALYQINPEIYHSNVSRLGEKTQQELDSVVIKRGFEANLMLFDKALFYQKIPVFNGIPGITLSFLADISQVIKIATGQSVSIDEKLNNYFFIVFKGSVEYYQKGNYVSDFQEGLFIGEMLSASGFMNSNLIVAKENTVLLKLPKELFYELLSNNVKLADKVLEYI